MTSQIQKNNAKLYPSSALELVATSLTAFATLTILGVMVMRSHAGIDLTDEGLYLNWMANPSNYPVSVTQFGFFYHWIYKIANGDVALIRQINYLITFGLAWLLCVAVLVRADVVNEHAPLRRGRLAFLSAAVASSSLLITCFELPQSPSYNTLVYQSLLLCVLGMVLAIATNVRYRIFGHVLIGISGWLAFMAKPTSAAALGVVVVLYLSVAGKLRLRLIAVAIVIAALLMLLSTSLIGGSPYAFIQQLNKSIAMGRILGGGNSLSSVWRWDSFQLSSKEQIFLFLNSSFVAILILLSNSARRVFRIAGVVASILCALASLLVAAGVYHAWPVLGRYQGLQMLALPIGSAIAAILMRNIRSFGRGEIALLVSLLLLPHVYAFGTDRPYWLNAEGASLFWILAGAVLVFSKKTTESASHLLPLCCVALLMTCLFLTVSMEHPHRQTQALRLNDNPVEIGLQRNQLLLSDDFAKYIRGLRQLAHDGAFKAGTPFIDLTGHSPSVSYILDGKAIGVPWLLGGYKGSEAFATAVLDMVPCREIADAWVLTEPLGPGKLPEAVLSPYGIDLKRDYDDLGEVQTPATPYSVSYGQHLFKPNRSHYNAESACESRKEK